ncbi:CYFA0S23e01266g1_1 [Cyberlindnera fabianii]|uniref:CYFA0S23e01266g1_1 n=1 Tax=Cyberlindnera fabianii TaxID=36022 RepID=A0A061BHL6_CYBFA|nr:CYFA0S23e01266g1_1 [Cyberlindnera fabianii]
MEQVPSYNQFEDFLSYEPTTHTPQNGDSNPSLALSFPEDQQKSQMDSRDDPFDIQSLQDLFTMPDAINTGAVTTDSINYFDTGLPVVSMKQFADTYFEDAMSLVNSPSLSNSLNTTPLSNATPSLKSSSTCLDDESTILFGQNWGASDLTLAASNDTTAANTLFNTSSSAFIQPLESLEYTSQSILPSTLSVNSSPYNSGYSSAASPDNLTISSSHTKNLMRPGTKTKSKSLSSNSSTRSSTSSASSTSSTTSRSRNSLDSRLSLQRLGEVLQTKSQEETMRIEKFILEIFQKDLKFPLGYKTWIRDTPEEQREQILEELHNRVAPTHPRMTKQLLETVIRRATYSMMQGRLRNERRAASKGRAIARKA